MPAGASRLRGEDLRAGSPNGMIEPNTLSFVRMTTGSLQSRPRGFPRRFKSDNSLKRHSPQGLKYNFYRATVPSRPIGSASRVWD